MVQSFYERAIRNPLETADYRNQESEQNEPFTRENDVERTICVRSGIVTIQTDKNL